MTAKVRTWPILLGSVALVAALPQVGGADRRTGTAAPALVSVAAPATPTPGTDSTDARGGAYVKYYTVAAGADGAESLAAIAGRLLGAANRAEELYRLNVGRRQADGQTLTDSRQLRTGWTLVLPWDAVGDGVRIGPLPSPPSSGPDQAPQVPPVRTPKPPATPGGGVRPPASSRCADSVPSRPDSGWAQERMAPDQAWGRTRGGGVLVAVVDSGVDAGLPELSGRVAVGADIPSGSGRGDVDCLGSGTAMASIIGARPADAGASGAPVVGIAPEATILPLRVVADVPQSKPADAATAIEVAVSAGARVVALGAFVDLADPAVAEAIGRAAEHDVVVVAPASTGTDGSPSPAEGSGPEALLRVGGVGPEGQPAAKYQPSAADVIAPGIDVASLGAGGSGVRASSGSQYAVAFVAGTATLVRSAFPNLSAAQVAHRIKTTADRGGRPDADPATGWGMIDPNAAVVTALAEEAPPAPDDGGGSGSLRILVIALLAVAGIAAIALLARRPGGTETAPDGSGDDAGDHRGEPSGREGDASTSGGDPAAPAEDPKPTEDDPGTGTDAAGAAAAPAAAAGTSTTGPAGAR
ncbi:peptidase S8 and S53 subtilisin kexin sedolisin [Micromonospora sp. 15K316]|uniref:S8 family serine peptidase n=1 Tax=Micromonospora sp. 15K316 TaxID=2530376 RepID=UPI00104B8A72|nr:S8 family serine peptidase [Micromonospora sp. 15K316]TDC34100.1 peptidase S8 and S53 subtilisin kexin sedolisin [Micromonospora sp. 15K316]